MVINQRPTDKYRVFTGKDSPIRLGSLGDIMEKKVEEKVTVKKKLLGGTEVKHEVEETTEGVLSGTKKVEKTVTKKKI
jgi:hypothetical protein